MFDHPHEISQYQFVGNFHDYLHVKINFITHFVLNIFQRNSNLAISGNMGRPRHTHLNDSINLIAGKKSTLSFTFSLRYWKNIAKFLFWIFWEYLATHTQNDDINLQKTSIFIYRQKINFITQIFLEISQRYANFLFWVLVLKL